MNKNTYRINSEYNYDSWFSDLTIRTLSSYYFSCHLTCPNSSYTFYVGKHIHSYWICFPDVEKSTTIPNLTATFWNSTVITDILDSVQDGISISDALVKLGSIVHETTRCQ